MLYNKYMDDKHQLSFLLYYYVLCFLCAYVITLRSHKAGTKTEQLSD